MQPLVIKDKPNTPEIHFDPESNILSMAGESYPENAREFYQPVMKWVNEYLKQPGNQQVTVNIDLKYFNSSTAKILMNFFDTLEQAVINGKNIVINWLYDRRNLNAVEYGEDFQEDLDSIPFHLIEKP